MSMTAHVQTPNPGHVGVAGNGMSSREDVKSSPEELVKKTQSVLRLILVLVPATVPKTPLCSPILQMLHTTTGIATALDQGNSYQEFLLARKVSCD